MEIDFTLNAPFDGVHTPWTCLLRAISVLLCDKPDKDWNHEEELKGWGLGECPLLPPCSVDNDELSDAWERQQMVIGMQHCWFDNVFWFQHDWNWNWYTHVCLTTPCDSTVRTSVFVHLESCENVNLERPGDVVWWQTPGRRQGVWLKKVCFGNLF